jgi:hypothetical protein
MSAYHDNEDVRIRIDKRLKANAARQANLGLDSTEDELYRAAKLWENDLVEIAKLDPEFAYSLHAQTD